MVFLGHGMFKSKGVCGFGEEQDIFPTECSEFISDCLSLPYFPQLYKLEQLDMYSSSPVSVRDTFQDPQ